LTRNPRIIGAQGACLTIRRKPELAFKAVGGITGEVTGEVKKLLAVMVGEIKRADIQKALALRHEDYFREAYLIPALTARVIEMTIPGKPTSSKQKYQLTQKGRDLIVKLAKKEK
jgi:ATP-dependent DNA helicase RecG